MKHKGDDITRMHATGALDEFDNLKLGCHVVFVVGRTPVLPSETGPKIHRYNPLNYPRNSKSSKIEWRPVASFTDISVTVLHHFPPCLLILFHLLLFLLVSEDDVDEPKD